MQNLVFPFGCRLNSISLFSHVACDHSIRKIISKIMFRAGKQRPHFGFLSDWIFTDSEIFKCVYP